MTHLCHYLPFKQSAIISGIHTGVDIGIAGGESDCDRVRVVCDGHVGGRERNMINYLIRCSACRDFIRFQNGNKFAMVMRVRYVRTKGLATMIDVDARGVLVTWSMTVGDNRSERARGDVLI